MVKYILFLLIFFTGSVYSQSNFEWKTYFGGNYERGAEPIDCVLDDAGNMYITGYEIGPSITETSLLNIYTIKVNPAGTILWKKSYGVPGYHEDTPYSICLDEAGNVYVTGSTPDTVTKTRTNVIIKYANNGTFIWEKKFSPYSNGSHLGKLFSHNSKLYTVDLFSSLTVLNVFSATSGDSLYALSSPGNTLRINNFHMDKNGNIYLNWVGNTWPSSPSNSLTKYDNNLNLIWSTFLDSSVSYSSISVDNYSNIYLSGIRGIFLGGGMMNTVKLNSVGNIQWAREYMGSINNYNIKNIVDNENNLLVLGASRVSSFSDSNDYALIKYTPAGDSSWVKRERTSLNQYTSYPRPLLDFGIDNQNNVYVFANIYPTSPSIRDYRISKYSSAGNLLKRVYNNNYMNMWSVSLFRVDKNGICYIAGETEVNPNSYNFTYIVKISGTVGINNSKSIYDKDFSLQQNFPNPFNSSTQIKFNLPKAGNVRIVVYDIAGKELQTLTNKFYSAGNQSINFNADKLSSGVFFYKVSYENYSLTKKMVLIK